MSPGCLIRCGVSVWIRLSRATGKSTVDLWLNGPAEPEERGGGVSARWDRERVSIACLERGDASMKVRSSSRLKQKNLSPRV